MIYGENIIIYGGAGWLGSRLVPQLAEHNSVTVFSRDEAKHHLLKLKCPKVNIINGDVCNYDEVLDATEGKTISINLAALKEIDTATKYPMRAIDTICNGAHNTKRAAEKLRLKAACLISSDKACAPTLAYGACKALAESIYVNNNKGPTAFSVCRYGNVAASRGSIIEVLNTTDHALTLYSDQATRFTITAQEAIDLIVTCIEEEEQNSIIIPKLKSYKVKDLFDIYRSTFKRPYVMGNLRPGEKLHESMYSEEESYSVHEVYAGYYVLNSSRRSIHNNRLRKIYSSENHVMTVEELTKYLEDNNYFKNV